MITSINKQIENLSDSQKQYFIKKYSAEALDFMFSASDFFSFTEDDDIELVYKDQVCSKSFDGIREILTDIRNESFLNKIKRPYFVYNLENIKRAIDAAEKIAVEGGPCLFGLEEVTIEIELNDGSVTLFDYSTGRKSCSENSDSILNNEMELSNFMLDNSANIKEIRFNDNKNGVTIDEYESIKILFDVASDLNCPFVMPIVDMSYQKYLEFATRSIDTNIRDKAICEFKNIVHRIADMYIDVANKLSKEYPNVEYLILHERDEKLLNLYYEKRTPYIERNKIIHSLTDVPIRLEPIKDYCTMPALPFYFYGIKNILQIDCLDETDSHRKCKKAHKTDVNISAILYPERIYQNGQNMFNSKLSDKIYI